MAVSVSLCAPLIFLDGIAQVSHDKATAYPHQGHNYNAGFPSQEGVGGGWMRKGAGCALLLPFTREQITKKDDANVITRTMTPALDKER